FYCRGSGWRGVGWYPGDTDEGAAHGADDVVSGLVRRNQGDISGIFRIRRPRPARENDHMSTASPTAASRQPRTTVAAFLTSSVAGVTHGLFSLYWFMGGSLLTDTVSAQFALLADRRWLLLTVAVVKTGFALLPLVLLAGGYERRRPIRVVCWFGATVLLLWGGVNTVTSNLVLAGFIQPSDD